MNPVLRHVRAGVSTAIAIAAHSVLAQAQISFHSPIAYPVGDAPKSVVASDVDSDGDLDLVVTVHNPAGLSVLRNDGTGEFAPAAFSPLTSGSDPVGLVAHDFTGDGHPDIVVASSANDTIRLYRNLGDGHYVPGDYASVGDGPRALVLLDFDLDGDMDLAVSNRAGGGVSFVRNVGEGMLEFESVVAVGATPGGLAVGDLDGDAYPDVAVAVHGSRIVRVLRNLGNGTFTTLTTLPLGNLELPEVARILDFDNDGDDDILVSASDTVVHDVVLFRQIAPGAFCECDYFDVGGIHPVGMALGDFDLDTRIDVATANSGSDTVSVLRNLSSAGFDLPLSIPVTGPEPCCIIAADLDGNHYADLVVTNDAAQSVDVIFNARDNPASYCSTSPNSFGYGARIHALGSVRIATNDFTLRVVDAVPNAPGLFFFGRVPQQSPFHAGYLCIAAPIARLGPALQTTTRGVAQLELDFGLSPASMIAAGTIWNFQFWYRDPAATSSTTNFSDAVRVVFEP